jgi:hypothetical protein
MDIKVYLEGPNGGEKSTVTHRDVMSYDIKDQEKELNLVFKSGEKKDISLLTVERVLVIKPCCIYHKDKGNLITKRKPQGDYAKRGD